MTRRRRERLNGVQLSYDELPDILTIADVCAYLALSDASVYRGLNNGDIPASRVGSTWIIGRDAFFEKFGWPRAGRPRKHSLQLSHANADRTVPTAGAPTAAPIPSPNGASAAAHTESADATISGPWRDSNYAASRLGRTARSVCEMCRRGEIRFFKRGREYLFQDEYIDEYIASRSGSPTAARHGATR